MIVLLIVIPLTSLAGVEQSIYKYSQGPGYSYSDMNGYGSSVERYFTYKIYWTCLGIVFYILTLLFYHRGVVSSFKERFYLAKQRFNGLHRLSISFFTILFLSIGGYIYYENNILNIENLLKKEKLRQSNGKKSIKNMKITFSQELHR